MALVKWGLLASVYLTAEYKGAPPCPFLTPPLCPQNLCTCALLLIISIYVHAKNGVSVLFSIYHVLRKYTTDIELTTIKLMTDSIVYHTYTSK